MAKTASITQEHTFFYGVSLPSSSHISILWLKETASDNTIIFTLQVSASGVNGGREQTASLYNLPKLSTSRIKKVVFQWM